MTPPQILNRHFNSRNLADFKELQQGLEAAEGGGLHEHPQRLQHDRVQGGGQVSLNGLLQDFHLQQKQ